MYCDVNVAKCLYNVSPDPIWVWGETRADTGGGGVN